MKFLKFVHKQKTSPQTIWGAFTLLTIILVIWGWTNHTTIQYWTETPVSLYQSQSLTNETLQTNEENWFFPWLSNNNSNEYLIINRVHDSENPHIISNVFISPQEPDISYYQEDMYLWWSEFLLQYLQSNIATSYNTTTILLLLIAIALLGSSGILLLGVTHFDTHSLLLGISTSLYYSLIIPVFLLLTQSWLFIVGIAFLLLGAIITILITQNRLRNNQ